MSTVSTARDILPHPVPIELDRPREILMDLNAFVIAEEKLGSIDNAFQGLQKRSLKAVHVLLYAGLVHEDEELTEKQAGRLVGLGNLNAVITAISEALASNVPQQKK